MIDVNVEESAPPLDKDAEITLEFASHFFRISGGNKKEKSFHMGFPFEGYVLPPPAPTLCVLNSA